MLCFRQVGLLSIVVTMHVVERNSFALWTVQSNSDTRYAVERRRLADVDLSHHWMTAYVQKGSIRER